MDENKKTYYIGDIAKELGLSQRAIRYYEELGIIRPTRTDGGFRTYRESDVDLLRIVLHFKELGMSLDEIRVFFIREPNALTGNAARHLREILLLRRHEIEEKVKTCTEGLHQIDRVLAILSDCATCGQTHEQSSCESCLKQHGGDSSPLITPLLSQGQEQKE